MTKQTAPQPIGKDLLPPIPPPEWEFHTVLGAPHGCMLLPGDEGQVVVRRRVSYGDWEPVRPDRWADGDVESVPAPASPVNVAEETHQGPGVYGGLETHRGARHACPAPDCGPQGVRIVPNHPDDDEGVTIHFPEVDYVDTQVWSVDVGVSADALRDLRDAIDKHLATDETAVGEAGR